MTSIGNVDIGDRLSLEKELTRPQLFRYSATTWNPHRIHYDPEYARDVEGHPDVLVQAHLHGAIIQELLMNWHGADGRLAELSWQNIGRAIPGEPLFARAKVTAIDAEAGHVKFEVWTGSEEVRCAEGNATVELTDNQK